MHTKSKDSWRTLKLSGCAKVLCLLPDALNEILNLIEGIPSSNKVGPKQNMTKYVKIARNNIMHVRRALKHGVQDGLINVRSGDLALYKMFQTKGGRSPCGKCKKGKMKSHAKIRRNMGSISSEQNFSDFSIEGDEPLKPMDRGRRRRRRKKRRRRRRHDGTVFKDSNAITDEPKKIPKNSREFIRPQRNCDKENKDIPHDSEEPIKVDAARDVMPNK